MNIKSLIFGVALAGASLTACRALDADVQVGPYTVSEISENVYHIQDCNDSNPSGETFDADGKLTHFNNCSDMYLLVGRDEALLIDLSNYVKWAEDAVESLRSLVAERAGDKPLTITFTHNHGDHTGMLPAYKDDPDVRFALPERDFRQMAGRLFGEDPAQPSERIYYINEGDKFALGGMTVATVLVPGHTAGSVVFALEGRDILFTGDAVGSGHGVWIFNTEAFTNYVSAVPHLIEYLCSSESGIRPEKLRIYGGHYWQKDWLDIPEGQELGMDYLYDMQTLLGQMECGEAATEPSGLGRPDLDTYFRNGSAIVVWNAAQAAAYSAQYEEKFVYRDADVVFRQIDEHTYEGNGHLCYNESIYLIEGEEKALLIDAGTRIAHLDKVVASLTDKPVMLVATHVHPDHTGSAVNLFPELYINAADTVNLQPGLKAQLRFLEDGEIIDLGGRLIEVMFTPGHTPGSTTFFDCEKHYGFSGDAFGSTNLLLTTSFSTLIGTTDRTAEYMKAHEITKLYPGHYHGDNPELLQRVLDLGTMSREVLAGTRKGVTEEGMLGLNSCVTDFGVNIRYNYPDALK